MIELIKGDCLIEMQNIPDGRIDCIICDLPYGTTACKWDSIIPFDKLWEQYKRIIKINGAIVLFGSQPFTSALISSNYKMFKYEWIWTKNTTSGFALSKKQPLRNHENILVFYSKQPTYNPIKELRDLNEQSKKRINYKFTTEKGVNEIQNGIKKVQFTPESTKYSYPKTSKYFKAIHPNNKDRFHPTQKPVDLIEYLVKTYTNENETVLDNTMGSGTTGVACKNLKRNFIGIELNDKYFEISQKRINETQVQTSLF